MRSAAAKPSRRKVVLDASVVVSAAFGGVHLRAFERAARERLLVSPPILAEFKRLITELGTKLSAPQRREFLRLIDVVARRAQLIELLGDFHLCRDPQDDAYLETCRIGRAHYLVTRDPDLLVLQPEELKQSRLGRLRILTPQGFLLELAPPPKRNR